MTSTRRLGNASQRRPIAAGRVGLIKGRSSASYKIEHVHLIWNSGVMFSHLSHRDVCPRGVGRKALRQSTVGVTA